MAARRKSMSALASASSGEHYFVVYGRRWRRSDPAIPEQLRAELVHELMDARRSVQAAKRSGSARAEKLARGRVQDAKLALGERGYAYWQSPDDAAQRVRAAAAIRALLSGRARKAVARSSAARARERAPRSRQVRAAANSGEAPPAPTICPSEVARTIGGESWRGCMALVREVAAVLVARGTLRVLQRGKEVPIGSARGPIRFSLTRLQR